MYAIHVKLSLLSVTENYYTHTYMYMEEHVYSTPAKKHLYESKN